LFFNNLLNSEKEMENREVTTPWEKWWTGADTGGYGRTGRRMHRWLNYVKAIIEYYSACMKQAIPKNRLPENSGSLYEWKKRQF
jgi:hypothetical protein